MRQGFIILLSTLFGLFSGSILSAQTNGFFNYSYEETTGKILLEVPKDRGSFIYVNYLSSGLGSNDIGLDRGQIGDTRIVQFEKYGDKLLLIQNNLRYRANTDNKLEKQSVEEAFAKATLGSFKIIETKGSNYIIDITSFVVRDAHHVARKLQDQKQGSYKFNKNKSAVNPARCKSFPKNTEFEAMISFDGKATGRYLKSVTASQENISLAVHHSFVELPDNNYSPRAFHPYSGYFPMTYKDYAVPIADDMNQRFIYRHRLEKKNPESARSEAVDPIVYYIDAGCPDPIKSALMDGAAWWNEAFEEAGFINGFQIKELPAGADPLDVRYNMIQWVHRSTRGWSYGASVSDPRTGEIIKGHVSLGSLRVRQDYLIMQALLAPFAGTDTPQENIMQAAALARLRQLAAHEVGHTIGLAHNFASSVNNRASVMDYPHPKLSVYNGELQYADAYDTSIGLWDKRTIKYGYSTFSSEENEQEKLEEILQETADLGLLYISDSDARPAGGAHPAAHLWDNGESVSSAFENMVAVRRYGLDNLGKESIKSGTPYSELEKLLVPVYMAHRYQSEALVKLIGGVRYNYAVKNGPQDFQLTDVPKKEQKQAVDALLSTLNPQFLDLGPVREMIPPSAPGYGKTRETFKGKTSVTFDPYSAAAASVQHVLDLMLNTQRVNRMQAQGWDMGDYCKQIYTAFSGKKNDRWSVNCEAQHRELFLQKIMSLIQDKNCAASVKNELLRFFREINLTEDPYTSMLINQFIEGNLEIKSPKKADIPPGSPIGCGHFH